jgi:hypothetical protein
MNIYLSQRKTDPIYGPRPEPAYSSYPEGRRDWFYILFGYCFRKKYIQVCEWTYYYKVFCLKYTMDGKKCIGLYDDPEAEIYNYENETYKATCYTFLSISFC